MWLYLIGAPVIVIIIVGSVLMGGAYTIVAIPVVVLALGAGVLWRMLGRVTVERDPKLSGGEGSGHRVVSPGELADARRAQQ